MKKTKKIVLISIYTTLAIVLDVIKEFIPFLNMPSGGSVNIALIPIALCSFHLGIGHSFISGVLWFVISSILGLNKYFISFGQIIFDYIIPSTILCLASIFYKRSKTIEIEIGILLAMIIRTLSICYSGAIYWFDSSAASGSIEAWSGSLIYNLPYSLATCLMLMLIIPLLLKTLKKYLV